MTLGQQQVVADMLIGFRELSDDEDQRALYVAFTQMLREIATEAGGEDVEEELRAVGEWLHEVLDEVSGHDDFQPPREA